MSRLAPREYGLVAHPNVHWLLHNESEVLEQVKRFAADMVDRAYMDIAGPPSVQDALTFRERKSVPLPSVRLHMRMVRGNLTGDPGIEVTCSDNDLTEIARWRALAALRQPQTPGLLRA